jgi:hypothetical protein
MSKRSKNQLPVFPGDGSFRELRRERRERAEQLVLRELLRPEFDTKSGALIGYRVLGVELRKVDTDLKSIRTRVLPGAAEMQLNLERSATEGLSERMRREREANGKDPEDRVERLHATLAVLPYIRDVKGDIRRLWPKRALG